MKGALADLFWRIFRPSLADAWDAGFEAGVEAESQIYWGPIAKNPYRDTNPEDGDGK